MFDMIKYICTDCNQDFSFEVYKKSSFCPNCGKHLQEVRLYTPIVIVDTYEDFFGTKLTPDQAQIDKLSPVYIKSPIEISAGNKFPSVADWVRRRNEVYHITNDNFHLAI